MAAILDTLRQEHVNLDRLLGVLAKQGEVFERADSPDFDLIEDILDYFENFPDRYHHPLENAILRRLTERDAAAAIQVGDLEGEHRAIAQHARSLRIVFRHVREEEEVSRDAVLSEIRSFLDGYHHHMNMEEDVLFIAAGASFLAEDWRAIEAESPCVSDPLSDDSDDDRYGRLRREIVGNYGLTELGQDH
jgi:hemerythrin-like domain-containing protein